MSLTSSLNNAFSGLSAASRRAEVVSNNVSNALVDGFTRKSVELSSVRHGGVRIEGITRSDDPVKTASRRMTDASLGAARTKSNALERSEIAFGLPGSVDALANRAAQFEADLRGLSNAPASVPDARATLTSAQNYAAKFRSIAAENSALREQADSDIARNVETLNTALERIEDLNARITRGEVANQDTTVLKDQRAILVDQISEIVPVRSYLRKDGAIALFTPTGGTLLDGKARVFEFTPSPIITPDRTLANGALSGLSVDGQPVAVNAPPGFFDGGSLAANFEVRDELIPELDARLDALARDLIERVQDPAVDPTLGVGDAGLFTDGGVAFDPLNELGLAGRIAVNASVDPDQGGALSNFRDGINAVTTGLSGDNTILRNILNALTAPVVPSAALALNTALSAPDMAAALTSDVTLQSLVADERSAYLAGEQSVLRARELDSTSVDTDDEMQKLIAIEQAYAANARVISVVDDLMQNLLNI